MAELVLCINVEIEISETWLGGLINFLTVHPNVAKCGRIRPNGASVKNQWRMRVQEEPYERTTGTHPIPFATGHAVLFRRSVLQKVGGFDERLGFTEDNDILGACFRLAILLMSLTAAPHVRSSGIPFVYWPGSICVMMGG